MYATLIFAAVCAFTSMDAYPGSGASQSTVEQTACDLEMT